MSLRRSTSRSPSRRDEALDTLGDIFTDYAASGRSTSGERSKPSSQAAAGMQREVVRLHELWQKSKRELSARESEAAEWKSRYQNLVSSELTRGQARKFKELESMTLEFKDKLRFMELQLASAREENERWGTSYEEVVRELEKQKALNKEQQADIERLEERLRRASEENEELVSSQLRATRDHEEMTAEQERALALQDTRVATLDGALARLREERDAARRQLEEAQRREEEQSEKVRESTRLLAGSEEKLQTLRSLKLSEQQLKVQVEHLKLDNARMVRLLSSTQEYAFWQDFVDDSGGVAYLPTKPAAAALAMRVRAKENRAVARSVEALADEWADVPTYERVYGEMADRPVTAKGEAAHWVPEEALRLSVHFRHEYLPHVPTELITEYLRQLNETWRVRETNRVARVRKKLTAQLRDARRKAKHATPYEAVMLQKQLRRSQEELADARHALLKGGSRGFAAKPRHAKLSGKQSEHVMGASLATVENLSRQLADAQREMRTLRLRLQAAEAHTPAAGGDVDRGVDGADANTAADEGSAFLDGCRWTARNATAVLEQLSDRVAALSRDLQNDVLRLSPRDEEYYLQSMRLQNRFVDDVDRAVQDALGRLRALQSTAGAAQGDYTRFLRSVRAEPLAASPPPASSFRRSEASSFRG